MRAVLTRAIIRIAHRAACDGTELIPLLDEPTLVYTYRSPRPPFAQVTPLGTILWNRTYMDQLSPLARRVVLRHECSHRDRSRPLKVLLTAMMGLLGVGLLSVVQAGLLVVRDGAYGAGALIGLVGLGLVLAAVLAVRVEEGLADYHALREVGEPRFLSAYDEIQAASRGTRAGRLVSRLVYPRPRTVVRIHRRIQRASNEDRSTVDLLYSVLKASSRTVR